MYTHPVSDGLEVRENNVIAAVDVDRQKYEKTVNETREKLLWDIKELVWRLGYT